MKLLNRDPSTASLPDDLLHQQLLRLQLLYAAGAVLWTMTCLFDVFLEPNGQRGPWAPWIEAACVVFSAVSIAYVRYWPAPERRRIDRGAALVIVHALAIALLNSWTPQPVTERPISGITLLLLLFGMIAPISPGRMLTVTIPAATMDPLGVWLAHLRGLPVPSPLHTIAMYHLNYACALIAVFPTSMFYRLGREVKNARALGSYQLIDLLGRGGMGEVWTGRHKLLARNAAIKLIRPDVLNGHSHDQAMRMLRRFELEAQATATLTSPHTIRVFDFGLTGDGTFYYVMELLNGRDLESLVREFGPLPPARAAHLIRQVCSSLVEAHALGLIHRDIKPANIFTCRMGLDYDFVKVLDFGIVKHEHRASAPTLITSGQITMGTPAYMAPEAIVGDGDIDRRADIYALGCVTYFLLTGTQVFDAPSPMKVLLQHVTETPAAPSRRAPHPVSAALDRFVMACLHKDPDQRPANVEELLRLLPKHESGGWTDKTAREWWESHLPALSQNRAYASGYKADDASSRALLQPSIY